MINSKDLDILRNEMPLADTNALCKYIPKYLSNLSEHYRTSEREQYKWGCMQYDYAIFKNQINALVGDDGIKYLENTEGTLATFFPIIFCDAIHIIDAITELGLTKTRKEAKEAVKNNKIQANADKITDINHILKPCFDEDKEIYVSIGKENSKKFMCGIIATEDMYPMQIRSFNDFRHKEVRGSKKANTRKD